MSCLFMGTGKEKKEEEFPLTPWKTWGAGFVHIWNSGTSGLYSSWKASQKKDVSLRLCRRKIDCHGGWFSSRFEEDVKKGYIYKSWKIYVRENKCKIRTLLLLLTQAKMSPGIWANSHHMTNWESTKVDGNTTICYHLFCPLLACDWLGFSLLL